MIYNVLYGATITVKGLDTHHRSSPPGSPGDSHPRYSDNGIQYTE